MLLSDQSESLLHPTPLGTSAPRYSSEKFAGDDWNINKKRTTKWQKWLLNHSRSTNCSSTVSGRCDAPLLKRSKSDMKEDGTKQCCTQQVTETCPVGSRTHLHCLTLKGFVCTLLVQQLQGRYRLRKDLRSVFSNQFGKLVASAEFNYATNDLKQVLLYLSCFREHCFAVKGEKMTTEFQFFKLH